MLFHLLGMVPAAIFVWTRMVGLLSRLDLEEVRERRTLS